VCGIVGSWSRVGSDSDGDRLREGLHAIRHRGPDDLGTFAWPDPSSPARVDLGLVRLAILDLSPAGHQPMTLAGGRYTISYNGEITNYIEIRDELLTLGDTFVSDGDTEVLLKGWARWGVKTLDRLEGMFAIAVLDTQARTVTLARDPYGIKPLFYAHTGDRLLFNSELRGLIAAGLPHPRLDWQSAVDYLQWGAYDHTERTFLDGVLQLAPGHHVTLDTTTGRLGEPTRYWWPSIATTFHGGYAEAADTVRSMFLASVERNLRSDVPLGIALSGGLDSSAIVGAVRQLEPDLPVDTFSYIAPGFAQSEHEWIARVARALDATSHTVEAQAGDLKRDLDDLILSQGEPFGTTSIYAQYRVFQLAREHGVIVTLDGQGGDELFAGYFGYPAQRMHSMIETGHWAAAVGFTRAWGEWPGRSRQSMLLETASQFVPRGMRGHRSATVSPLLDASALAARGVSTSFPLAGEESGRGVRLKGYLRTALTRRGLPALLRHGDRNSMRFSIESRVPFLDRGLTEFVLSLPEDWLIGGDGTSKRILRDAVRGWIPQEVIDRRDKIGFATPQDGWLDELGALPADPAHPIGFLRPGRDHTVTGGLSETELRWGAGSHWRLINLRRWVALMSVDAA